MYYNCHPEVCAVQRKIHEGLYNVNTPSNCKTKLHTNASLLLFQ